MDKTHQVKKIFFVFGALVLIFVILEVLLILFEPILSKNFYQYDPTLGFRVRSYTQGSNKFGFNDRDYPLTKDPNSYRILIISDSFNWANGKESNYVKILEKKFEDLYGSHRVDIINAGYPSTQTDTQLALLKKFGLRYQPDMVILGFFTGNDFIDADPDKKTIALYGILTPINKQKTGTLFGRAFVLKSRIWLILNYHLQQQINCPTAFRSALRKIFRQKSPVSASAATNPGAGTFLESAFLDIERARLKFCNTKTHAHRNFDLKKQYVFDNLREMRDLLKESHIDFLVALYPDQFQVDRVLLDQIFNAYKMKREYFDPLLMQKILREFFNSENIAFIDLLEQFTLEGQKKPLYKFRDTHWNTAGEELAAEILFKALVGKIKLPNEPLSE